MYRCMMYIYTVEKGLGGLRMQLNMHSVQYALSELLRMRLINQHGRAIGVDYAGSLHMIMHCTVRACICVK